MRVRARRVQRTPLDCIFSPRTLIITLLVVTCIGSSPLAKESCAPSGVDTVIMVSAAECCPERAWPAVEKVIAAELGLLGFPILKASDSNADEAKRRRSLERMVNDRKAAAAVWIARASPESDDVEIWIADRLTGKTTVRTHVIDNDEEEDKVTVAALLTVSALRTSFAELGSECMEEPQTPTVEAEIKTVSKKTLIDLFAGGSLLGSPGGAGLRGGVTIGFGWYPFHWGGLELEGLYTPFGGDVSTASVESSISVTTARLLAVWNMFGHGFLRPALFLTGGMAFITGEGERGDDFALTRETAYVGYLGIGGILRVWPSHRLSVSLKSAIGITVPKFELLHGDERAARMGRPMIDGVLTMEVWFP